MEISVVFGDSHHELRGTHLASELGQHPPGAQVFHEVIMPVPSLALFGAGDDAMPLVRIAKQMGWHVRIFDSRPSYATRQRFPEADEVTVASTESLDECVHLDAACLAVVMTHRFAEDVNICGGWPRGLPPISACWDAKTHGPADRRIASRRSRHRATNDGAAVLTGWIGSGSLDPESIAALNCRGNPVPPVGSQNPST